MPDPLHQTISATQSPALFGASPYITRWMLWQNFARGVSLDQDENPRMSWGKKLQPLLIAQAAEELRLEVRPNVGDMYHRRDQLGCTRDATIICPDRGPGALETKCVFDYATWMSDWAGGKRVPRHYEIQLQQQMLVGDDEPYQWGVIAAWVAGDVHYFERNPILPLWRALREEAEHFFEEVRDEIEPAPFGEPIEIPLLTELFPVVAGSLLDLREQPDGIKAAETARLYERAKAEESALKRTAEKLKAELLALAKGTEEIALPEGIKVRLSTINRAGYSVKPSTYTTVKVHVPDETSVSLEEVLRAG